MSEHTGCAKATHELSQLRWRALIPCCFIMFGSYYIYDFPGTLGAGPASTIQYKFYQHNQTYTQEMNQVLYSVYSWPNTVLAIFGGLLIDKYLGLRKALLLFTLLVATGAGVFWVGVVTTNYPLLVIGRVLFGLGGESGYVSQVSMAARWFKGKPGMSLAYGMTISISRLAATMNFYFSLSFSEKWGIDTAVLFGFIIALFSVGNAIVLCLIDTYAEKKGTRPPLAGGADANPEDEVKVKDIAKLPMVHWLVCLITSLSYCSLFPFVGVAKNFLERKYNMSGEEASRIAAIFQFSAVVGCPLFGIFIDKIGRFAYWIILSCAVFAGTHFLAMFWETFPAPLMIAMLGVGYAFLFSSLWPAVPYIIPKNLVGVAYGVMTAIQNTGLAIVPLIAGAILDIYTPKPVTSAAGSAAASALGSASSSSHSGDLSSGSDSSWSGSQHHTGGSTGHWLSDVIVGAGVPKKEKNPLPTLTGYRYTELLFAVCAGIAILGGIVLLIRDRATNKVLTSSPEVRAEIQAREEAEKEGLIQGKEDPLP